jgi:peptidoglycan/LPS O-acetylase OafA/YrhL
MVDSEITADPRALQKSARVPKSEAIKSGEVTDNSIGRGVHVPALDGIRGLAILFVLVYHLTIITPGCPLDEIVAKMADAGWFGVDLFFVLSGFLITGILYDAKGQAGYFRSFYMRRTLRILPLYYAVVFFSLIVLPNFPHPKLANFGRIAGDEIWYWAYMSNYLIGYRGTFRHGILDVSWSLAIEEQFYLLWPLVVYFFGRRALMRICVGVIVVAVATRTVMVFAQFHPIAIYVLTPCRMDALSVGALVAMIVRGKAHPNVVWKGSVATLIVTGLVSVSVLLMDDMQWNGRLVMTLGYTVLAVFFGALLLLAWESSPASFLSKGLRAKALTILGCYSYAIYLFHLPVRAAIRDLVFKPEDLLINGSQLVGQVIFYVAAGGATLLLALLSWHLYEKQFLKLKKYFPMSSTIDGYKQ